MAGSQFDVEQVRLAAARGLPASCYEDFLRLSRTLVNGPVFQWLLVDAPDEGLRKRVMAALDPVLSAAGLSSNSLPLSDRIVDVAALEARLVKNAQVAAVVHVVGQPGWFDAARWDAFNVRRERLADEARARLVFWLDAEAIALASRGAPDLWAWRGGVYTFVHVAEGLPSERAREALPAPLAPLRPRPEGADTRSMAERSRRVAEIRAWLSRVPAPADELLVAPVDELGRLLFDLGDHDAALQHWRDVELPLHRRLNDARAEANTRGQIADILQARGQRDEALRIRREEQLPVYERLGDVRGTAVTMGKIADILQARGQLDEALRIRREEELPVYERLGEVREKAVTMGKIADILQARGQLDEALRVRREEELPVYERLGEVRERAIASAKMGLQLLSAGGTTINEARELLEAAYSDLSRMGLPEAGMLAEAMRKRGLTPTRK
jgi:tetratricopeptide (TPR) repeat protein